VRFDVIITAEFERSVERQIKPIMERDLNEIRKIIHEEAVAPKSGREYRLPGGGRYRASAPGEPAARRTGALLASITEPNVRREGAAIVGEIRITAPYAVRLERGEPRLAPRPFARPAVEELLRRLR
jgi:hypothetical protein